MHNYFEPSITYDEVYFDMEYFLRVQKDISNKWVMPDDDMRNLDSYLLHTIEEVWESKDASTKEEKLGELIDVLMYTGSMKGYIDVVLGEEMKTPLKLYLSAKDIEEDPDNVNLDGITDSIIEIRRQFPERKWHKPMPKFTDENIKERRYRVVVMYNNLVTKVITSIFKSGYYIPEINEALNEKESFILKLK